MKVKNPMDLQTVTTKFNDGMYINFKEFYDDIKLIFSNCRSYNDELSEMYKYAEEMDNFFISIADPVKKKCAEETGLKLKMRISGNELKLD